MSETKTYYWIQLKRDFFKRHDMEIIESVPNGKEYVLFYLKLLLESVDHEGELRFSQTIPYNLEMMATITRTNIDIVRSAIKLLTELELIKILDDGTLYMNQLQKMIGHDTSDAIRMREIRENKKQLLMAKEQGEQCSETFKNRSPELELELDKELEKDKEGERAREDESLKKPETTISETLLYSWYAHYLKKTCIAIQPSEIDRKLAVEAMRQLNGDKNLGEQAVAYYWEHWEDLWFAYKKADRLKPPGQRKPDYSFGSFARNIASCVATKSTVTTEVIDDPF